MIQQEEKPRCPDLVVRLIGDETYSFCKLTGRPCIVAYGGNVCVEYEEFLSSLENY